MSGHVPPVGHSVSGLGVSGTVWPVASEHADEWPIGGVFERRLAALRRHRRSSGRYLPIDCQKLANDEPTVHG